MILEANVDVMSSLREFYKALLESNSFPLTTVPTCSDGVNTFEAQINNMIYSFKMHIARAKLLIRISAARKSLVSIIMGDSGITIVRALTFLGRSYSTFKAKPRRKWRT